MAGIGNECKPAAIQPSSNPIQPTGYAARRQSVGTEGAWHVIRGSSGRTTRSTLGGDRWGIRWGCTKVSPACDHTATRRSGRGASASTSGAPEATTRSRSGKPVCGSGSDLGDLGDVALYRVAGASGSSWRTRRTGTTERLPRRAYWRQPIHWNAVAERDGERARVFCASMADVVEWKKGLAAWRRRLWVLIEETPALDWLLPTKRPHLVRRLAPWGETAPFGQAACAVG